MAKQVIERCLIKDLERGDIFSAVTFGNMEDKQVANLARESHEVMVARDKLLKKRAMLEEGQAAFRKELGGF